MIKYTINQGYFKAVTGREIPCSDSIKLAAAKNGGDSATVKRFRRSKKNFYLLPENADYSPIRLTTDDFESGEARILGGAREVKIKL